MQVWWEDLDSQNRPILMVRLGRALNECKSKSEADRVAEVIVSQVGQPSLRNVFHFASTHLVAVMFVQNCSHRVISPWRTGT